MTWDVKAGSGYVQLVYAIESIDTSLLTMITGEMTPDEARELARTLKRAAKAAER